MPSLMNMLHALKAVRNNGMNLQHLPDELKTDKIEAEAIAQNSEAAKFTRKAMQPFKEVVNKVEETFGNNQEEDVVVTEPVITPLVTESVIDYQPTDEEIAASAATLTDLHDSY